MRGSIGQKFQRTINKCDICFCPYNRTTNVPLIICTMHHTICKSCVDSLRIKPNCPFCREKIIFEKVVINNYIFELLPQQPNQPPLSPSPSIASYQPQPAARQEDQNAGDPVAGGLNINHRPLEHVYPQGYDQEWEANEQNNRGQLPAQTGKIILIIVCAYFPFLFCNLFLALTQPYSICMDKPQYLTIFVVRPWLLGIGIADLVIYAGLLVPLFFFKVGCCYYSKITSIWTGVGIFAALKSLIWAVVQIELFARVIAHYCTGFVFVYGIILTVIHSLLLLALCCCSGTRSGI